MAKDGKHVIHAGGIFANPQLHREGAAAAATQPGTVGFFDNTFRQPLSTDHDHWIERMPDLT